MRQVRRFLFGGGGGGSVTADLGLLILRVFTGLSLTFAHGIGKLPGRYSVDALLRGRVDDVPRRGI